MNINQAYLFCESIANKDRRGTFGPDEFNLWAESAQDAVFKRMVPEYGKIEEVNPDLTPFISVMPDTETDDAGKIGYPEFYYKVTAVFTINEDGYIQGAGTKLTDAELGIRELSRLKPPTEDYPAFCFMDNHIQVSPRKKLKVRVFYVRRPKKPNFDYAIVNLKPVYNNDPDPLNAGETGTPSVDFELPGMNYEVCFRILQYAGVNLTDQMLLQYGLTLEQLNRAQ